MRPAIKIINEAGQNLKDGWPSLASMTLTPLILIVIKGFFHQEITEFFNIGCVASSNRLRPQ